jgi:DNA-binding NarL/FixJ family response regulator
MMPDLDGLEVCRRVRQAAPETNLIIVTAFDDTDIQTIAVQNGVCAFVPKHSAAVMLERVIHRVFAETSASRTSKPGDAAWRGSLRPAGRHCRRSNQLALTQLGVYSESVERQRHSEQSYPVHALRVGLPVAIVVGVAAAFQD